MCGSFQQETVFTLFNTVLIKYLIDFLGSTKSWADLFIYYVEQLRPQQSAFGLNLKGDGVSIVCGLHNEVINAVIQILEGDGSITALFLSLLRPEVLPNKLKMCSHHHAPGPPTNPLISG